MFNMRRSRVETLTLELQRAVEEAGDSPVRLMDPQTHRANVLVGADDYERMPMEEEDRLEQAAFLRAAKKNAKARLMEDA
jgi:PHD/YefM family antitoxin component YafN of YafNO toxin-antitoxin module